LDSGLIERMQPAIQPLPREGQRAQPTAKRRVA
jgi:hypothetical protein